ncbi:hypothetical protein LEP1GSC175_1756 [Leptospira santarosai str. HAI821]|nr:hypothetical protein LEP1GSC175_1756 [Leptospira santarosai str. HAI821]
MHHRLSNFSFLNGDSSATQHHNSEFTFKPMGFHYAGIGKIVFLNFIQILQALNRSLQSYISF